MKADGKKILKILIEIYAEQEGFKIEDIVIEDKNKR